MTDEEINALPDELFIEIGKIISVSIGGGWNDFRNKQERWDRMWERFDELSQEHGKAAVKVALSCSLKYVTSASYGWCQDARELAGLVLSNL